MKKSIFKSLLLLVLAVALVLSLASCKFLNDILPDSIKNVLPDGLLGDGDASDGEDPDGNDPDGEDSDGEIPDVSGVAFEDMTVIYDGNYHTLEIDREDLPSGVSVLYSTNKYMKAGEYTVTADFYYAGKQIEGASKTATLTIDKASYDLSGVILPSLTKTYDGAEATVALEGRLPSGVAVSYSYKDAAGNDVDEMVNAGVYTVWATFDGDDENYHPIDPISATVEIRKVGVSGLSFSDARFDYDGTPKFIYVSGAIPEGVTVSYSGNGQTELGIYTVVASFSVSANYEPIADMTATLSITNRVHDMSGVSLLGKTVTYTGTSQMIALSGTLPAGVTVTYTVTDADGNVVDDIVNVGTYTVVASFEGGIGFEPIEDMTATVVVNKAAVSSLAFSDAHFYYDGTAKTVAVSGTLPEGATVEYVILNESGVTVSEIKDYGTYTVTAKFYLSSNYESIDDMTATVTVVRRVYDMSGVTLPSATVSYDGTSKKPALAGELPEGVTATYLIKDSLGNVVSDIVNAGTYTVTVSFTGDPYADPIADMTATVVVNKMVVTGISFADKTFTYDGSEKSLAVEGLPAIVSVTYTGNGKSAPGTYTVTATFSADANVEPIAPMTATMTIEIGDPLANPTTTLTYEKVSGGYAVSGITNSPVIVVIPATYEGESVVSIKSNAFRGMDNIEFVYIPETVKTIGNATFMDCTKLRTLYFADFSVTVGADGNLVTVGASALTTIGQKAFANTAIEVVDLPDSLVAMGYGVFEGCRSITKMTVPFVGGSSATSHAYLGYLFGSDSAETSYMNVPATLKTVIVSDNCKEIPARAFMGLSGIESIHVGRSVEKIGNNAFKGCTGLSDIYLPASVKSIPAAASADNSPFFGCSADLMIVVESAASSAGYGAYYAALSGEGAALVILNKTYEDYLMNKDSYRVSDVTDSKAAGIYVGGAIVSGFDPATLTYTVGADINTGYGRVSAIAASSAANVVITQAQGGVAKVVITSADGLSTTTYTINFTVEGTFESTSAIVGKDGSKGTVSFVIDDGYAEAANFAKAMLAKYPNLALNFAIMTRKFATYETVDTNGDGIMEPKLDADGNYVYTVDQPTVDFWRDILTSASGRTEILPHSHDHGFWGMNDEGGTQVTVSNRNQTAGASDSLLQGGSTMQIWGAQQIISDIFGDLGSQGITYVTPGIVKHTGSKAISADYTVKFTDSPVWLISDTAVSVGADGSITLNSPTEISLQSVNVTLPAGTVITTNAAVNSNVIAAGSVVIVKTGSVVIPAGTTVLGYGAFYDALYEVAYNDGVMIAARNTGASGTSSKGYYTKDYFTTKEHRLLQRSFGISVSDSTTEATVDGWVSHIDAAVEKGVWVSYCIHNILTPSTASGNYILEDHAERLFSQAAGYGSDIWIATYTEATKYYHEWSSATVSSSYDAASDSITVSLTDGERDDIYDMPLTVKLSVPGTWSSATVGGEALEIRTAPNGSLYVYVNVAPETTVTVVGN